MTAAFLLAVSALGLLPAGIGAAAPQEGHGDRCINTDVVDVPFQTSPELLPASRYWDYGDAPDSTKVAMTTFYTPPGAPIGNFPTLAVTANSAFGTPGARHQIVNIGWLGNDPAYAPAPNPALLNVGGDPVPSREYDADTPFDPDPTTNLVGGLPDQDFYDRGLRAGVLTAGGVGTVTFRLSSTTGFSNWYVNVLFDWDYSGTWVGFDPMNGAAEWAVVNMPVSMLPLTSQSFTSTPFLVGTTAYQPWVRITLSDTPVPGGFYPMGWDGSTPPGTIDFNGQPAFGCGETEDYCGQIFIQPRDFFKENVSCEEHPRPEQ